VGLKSDLDNQVASFGTLMLLDGYLACKSHPENDL